MNHQNEFLLIYPSQNRNNNPKFMITLLNHHSSTILESDLMRWKLLRMIDFDDKAFLITLSIIRYLQILTSK
ncbi:hypothetical protein ACJX0J_024029, partial [Zea mays]